MTDILLPPIAWRDAPDLKRIIEILSDDIGGPLIVGGAVRDSLLGTDVTDVDIATPLHPETVIEKLEALRIKAIPTGIDHGTITAVGDGKNYEITTLRRDVATDGRRATVAFADTWQEDAERRDFTINALYADATTGKVYDYFGGLADLQNGDVRFIGDARQRIKEDYLRILRYFRFFARFGKDAADPEAIEACAELASGLSALSRERIAQELLKLLSANDPVLAVGLMLEHGIFAAFLPEICTGADKQLATLVAREQKHKTEISLATRLLAILPKDAAIVENVAARLKLSNRMREALAAPLKTDNPSSSNIRSIAYKQGISCAHDATMLFAENDDLSACLVALDNWQVPVFSIKGGDLIARGISAGPLVAKTLRAVENQWISENFPETERLNKIADQAAAAATASLADKKS